MQSIQPVVKLPPPLVKGSLTPTPPAARSLQLSMALRQDSVRTSVGLPTTKELAEVSIRMQEMMAADPLGFVPATVRTQANSSSSGGGAGGSNPVISIPPPPPPGQPAAQAEGQQQGVLRGSIESVQEVVARVAQQQQQQTSSSCDSQQPSEEGGKGQAGRER